MRGSPLMRVLLVVIGLLLLLWPLRSLTTHRVENRSTPKPSPATAESDVHLALTSTSVPFTFEVSHLGKTIWKGDATESPVTHNTRIPFPAEGVDLLLDVKWQSDKQGAAKLDVTLDNGETITKTLWGTGGATDLLTFKKP